MPKGKPEVIPNRQQLRHWAEVCCFLDAEPYRSVFYPFQSVADPPHEAPMISARLLQRMERFGLVRHRSSDGTWRLSLKWQHIMERLLQGPPPEEEKPPKGKIEQGPFIADFGIDTLYVNALADDLPAKLVDQLSHYKEMAKTPTIRWSHPGRFWASRSRCTKQAKGHLKARG